MYAYDMNDAATIDVHNLPFRLNCAVALGHPMAFGFRCDGSNYLARIYFKKTEDDVDFYILSLITNPELLNFWKPIIYDMDD